MSAEVAQNTADSDEIEAPRRETEVDMYGEPVVEWGTESEYWEGYVPDDHGDRLMIAKYVRDDGEWVKTGLERAHITNIHQEAYQRRKNGGE